MQTIHAGDRRLAIPGTDMDGVHTLRTGFFSMLFFDEGQFDRRKSLFCRCLRRSGELFNPFC